MVYINNIATQNSATMFTSLDAINSSRDSSATGHVCYHCENICPSATAIGARGARNIPWP